MEELAKKMQDEINTICGRYYYYKDENILNKSRTMADEIRSFCSHFLQENIFGVTAEEYGGFRKYVLQVLEDYMEALKQQDMVLMLDTLDYGLRELLNIYIDTDAEETEHE